MSRSLGPVGPQQHGAVGPALGVGHAKISKGVVRWSHCRVSALSKDPQISWHDVQPVVDKHTVTQQVVQKHDEIGAHPTFQQQETACGYPSPAMHLCKLRTSTAP